MILDIHEDIAQGQGAEAAMAQPAVDLPASFGEAFGVALDYQRKVAASDAMAQNKYDIVQERLDDLYAKTGERIENPLGIRSSPGGDGRRNHAWSVLQDRMTSLATERPELEFSVPMGDDLERAAIERAVPFAQARQRMDARDGSGLGGFAGDAVGAIRDPVNMMSMLLGAPVGAGFTRTVATEALIGSSSEAVIQAMTFDRRQQIEPGRTMSDAAMEVAAAGVGAGVLAGGIKGLAAAWGRFTGPKTRSERDAGNVIERRASVSTSRFQKTPAGDAAHDAAVNKAAEDIAVGRPVELPPEAFLQAQARPGRVYTADGQSVGVNYEVVELADLITSHNDDFVPNEAFPANLQPRDRERPISRDQINSIAARLEPERLGPSPQAESGAPVVGSDNLVESGNARIMAVRRAYQKGGIPADNYKAFLQAQGFDVEGMNAPVLVARRITDLDDAGRQAFVVSANRPSTLRLSATEQAMADARLIDDGMLQSVEGGDLTTQQNRPFLNTFMSKLARSDQGAMVDADGQLSVDGKRRVQAAVLARAYDQPQLLSRILEDADNNIRSIGNAMIDAAPYWARMRDAVKVGKIPAGMDITDDVMAAINLVARARDERRPFAELLNQAEMFNGPSEISKLVGRFMFKDGDLSKPVSQKALTGMLQDYATEAEKNVADARLFGDPLGEADVLNTALRRAGRDDLQAVAEERLTDEAIDKMLDDPAVDDAVILEADRMRALALTSGRQAAESPADVALPPVPSGMVRMYHSGEDATSGGGRWFSTNRAYGENYRQGSPTWYVDVPADSEIFAAGREIDQGPERGFTFNSELPEGDVARAQEYWNPQTSGEDMGDLMIPVTQAVDPETGVASVNYRSLNDLMDEADAEEQAAGVIEACASGKAVEAAQ